MPKLSAHQSTDTTKLLFIGDSGTGKTGALASLVVAGYNLRIADMDNGLDILKGLLSYPGPYAKTKEQSDEFLGRVDYVTLTDPMRQVNGRPVPAKATVWTRLIGLMTNWPELGPISNWTSKDVLAIDSLTFACKAAMAFVLSQNARLGQPPQQSDWYAAQQLVEGLVQTLYDEGVKCNVVVNCHIVFIGEDNGPQHGYPASLGKALSPTLGRWFNSMLLAKTTGFGASTKRKILTQSTHQIELKSTSPNVKPEYPLESGLADYFAAVR